MPLLIDPAWEYFTVDPEIEELLHPPRETDFDAVWDRRQEKAELLGFRFGRGNPDFFRERLAREKPTRQTLGQRLCRACEAPFYPDRDARRYCSDACRPRPGKQRTLADQACLACATSFRPWYAGQHFCSAPCSVQGQRKPAHESGCQACGKDLPPSTSNNHQPRKYCSARCKRAASSRAYRQRKSTTEAA